MTWLALVRSIRPSPARLNPPSLSSGRGFQASAIVHKKRSKQAALEDLFGDEEDVPSDTLLGDQAFSLNASPHVSSPAPQKQKIPRGLSPSDRHSRFNELSEFVQTHTGRSPTASDPKQVRNTAWLQLLQLASSEDDIRRVANMFSAWTAGDRKFGDQHARAFVRRCRELGCPKLAVEVFSNRPQYRFDLTSIRVARELLYSVQREDLLEQSVIVSALYTLYNLPSLADDLISCSLLLAQCLRADTNEARAIADALLPSFKAVIKREPPHIIPSDPVQHLQTENVQQVWLRTAVGIIDKRLRSRGEDTTWLRTWRIKSGFIPNHTQSSRQKHEGFNNAERNASEGTVNAM